MSKDPSRGRSRSRRQANSDRYGRNSPKPASSFARSRNASPSLQTSSNPTLSTNRRSARIARNNNAESTISYQSSVSQPGDLGDPVQSLNAQAESETYHYSNEATSGSEYIDALPNDADLSQGQLSPPKDSNMYQDIGDPNLGKSLHLSGNVMTAGRDINVTVTSTETSILKHLMISLKPVTSASYNSYEARPQRSECFPNTRVQVLHDIEAWIKGESHQSPIYILDGVAGIGKSTIAQTVASRAAKLKLLGATFFFSRDEEIRTAAKLFFPTIAYQLSCYDNTVAAHINHALEQAPDVSGRMLSDQLSLLLLKPLEGLLSQRSTPILIIIDALDECKENDAEELLTLFGQHSHQMKGLKILITSRPEEHIRDVLDLDGNHEKFCLHEIEDSIVQSDIQLYLKSRLSKEEIRKVSRNKRLTWESTNKELEVLCGLCGTLFVIAATAVKFILDSRFHPQEQLSCLLDGVTTSDFSGSEYLNTLDHTYIRILCTPLSGHVKRDKEWLGNLNKVLGALISLANPLPCPALALLLELKAEVIEATLSPLHSLVAPTGNGANMRFRIHHKSFPDFITDKGRIEQAIATLKTSVCPGLDLLLWVNVIDQHFQLAKACFKAMERGLKWNMANIEEEDWYKDKEDIPHVGPQLITRDLAYAALHWASHLVAAQKSNEDPELQAYLDDWVFHRILSWIETMVILNQVDAIYGMLQDAIKSLKCTNNSWAKKERVLGLLSDACRLVQQGAEVMKISPMHIYRSCLPFAPMETSIYDIYGQMATLGVELGKSCHWNPLLVTLIGHSSIVESVAFSSNGSRLASGSWDNTIRLWDASTGARQSTLTGHSDTVTSVAFSSNGSQLASGSWDSTIRLWDASTGAHQSTLTGHSSAVTSVAFSSNGFNQLASGSWDKTVRLWDTSTGAHKSTLTGHSSRVTSVAFSSDGSRLASGSWDRTVRLWDASTGAHRSTLTGHSDTVTSVGFSSYGARLASGSKDKTVRLWDASTGAHLSTLTGHSDFVNSVAFSSDGSQLASGSWDNTVRLWDASTCAHRSTLAGHSNFVCSIAFSNNGSRLASGSWDHTVRLWDPSTGAHRSTLTGHSDFVKSVAFSSDGSRLASGSKDNTVRLWDASRGAHWFTLTGHSDLVNSVAFSSDGSQLASGSWDNTVRLWDASTGAHLSTLTGHSSPVHSVAFSSNGSQLASGSDDVTLCLWDANTGAHQSTLTGHSSTATSVAFSSDGSQLASGHIDNTVQLWDVSTGAHRSILTGHSSRVESVAFSSDGSQLASGSWDNTVRLWDASTGTHRSTLTGHSFSINFVQSVLFLPNRLHMTSRSQPLLCTNAAPISLLLLVKRVNPPISGIVMAKPLVMERGDDFRWEVVPVCWFPPDIQVECFSINPTNAWLAIGCHDGRIMTLNFISHNSDHN